MIQEQELVKAVRFQDTLEEHDGVEALLVDELDGVLVEVGEDDPEEDILVHGDLHLPLVVGGEEGAEDGGEEGVVEGVGRPPAPRHPQAGLAWAALG